MLGILWFVVTFAAWMCLVYLFLVIVHVGTKVGLKVESEKRRPEKEVEK